MWWITSAERMIPDCPESAIIPNESKKPQKEDGDKLQEKYNKIYAELERLLKPSSKWYTTVDELIQFYIEVSEILTSEEFKSTYEEISDGKKKDIKNKLEEILNYGQCLRMGQQLRTGEEKYIYEVRKYIQLQINEFLNPLNDKKLNDLKKRTNAMMGIMDKRKKKIRDAKEVFREVIMDVLPWIIETIQICMEPGQIIKKCEKDLRQIKPLSKFNSIIEKREYLENIINAILPLEPLLYDGIYENGIPAIHSNTIGNLINKLIKNVNPINIVDPIDIEDQLYMTGHPDYAIEVLSKSIKYPYIPEEIEIWLEENRKRINGEEKEDGNLIYSDLKVGSSTVVVATSEVNDNGEIVKRNSKLIKKEIRQKYEERKRKKKNAVREEEKRKEEGKKYAKKENLKEFTYEILTNNGNIIQDLRIEIEDLNEIVEYFKTLYPEFMKIDFSNRHDVFYFIKEVEKRELENDFILIFYKYLSLCNIQSKSKIMEEMNKFIKILKKRKINDCSYKPEEIIEIESIIPRYGKKYKPPIEEPHPALDPPYWKWQQKIYGRRKTLEKMQKIDESRRGRVSEIVHI